MGQKRQDCCGGLSLLDIPERMQSWSHHPFPCCWSFCHDPHFVKADSNPLQSHYFTELYHACCCGNARIYIEYIYYKPYYKRSVATIRVFLQIVIGQKMLVGGLQTPWTAQPVIASSRTLATYSSGNGKLDLWLSSKRSWIFRYQSPSRVFCQMKSDEITMSSEYEFSRFFCCLNDPVSIGRDIKA